MWPGSPGTRTLCFWQDLVTTAEELVSSEPRVKTFIWGYSFFSHRQVAGMSRVSPPPHTHTSQPPHTAERPSCREKVDGAGGMFPNVLGSGLGGKGIQLIVALHDSGLGSLHF